MVSSKSFPIASFLASVLPLTAYSFTTCPLQGPSFPPPTNLSDSATIQAATVNLTELLDQTISLGQSSFGVFDAANTSYSLSIFTKHDAKPLYTKYHSSDALKSSSVGVKEIGPDTVYRIGSLTKLFAAYTLLIQIGDRRLNDPVTKYIPELAAAAKARNATEDPIDHIAWEDITLGDLMGHTSGVGREYGGLQELTIPLSGVSDPTVLGLPPLAKSDDLICLGAGFCNRTQFLKGFSERHPVYAPESAATYSNVAFQILTYAVENITGVDFETMVKESLFKPLNLTASYWRHPPPNNTAIVSNPFVWALDLGDETAAGGMYSTLSNITTIGQSILRSSLLKPITTRRWMKPRTFTSSPSYAVGTPWEITRLPVLNGTQILDMYTKTGDLPGYASFLVLIPSLDLGFAFQAAGSASSPNIAILAGQIAEVYIPAVALAAREQAEVRLAGTYSIANPASNITIAVNSSLPGLGVTEWYSNGTNMLLSKAVRPSVRLYPTGLEKKLGSNGDKEISFRAVLEDPKIVRPSGTFTQRCISWAGVDSITYGSVASDEFVFVVDSKGMAKSISPRVLRVELKREDS